MIGELTSTISLCWVLVRETSAEFAIIIANRIILSIRTSSSGNQQTDQMKTFRYNLRDIQSRQLETQNQKESRFQNQGQIGIGAL
jgi:hypothetical protein